MKIYRVSGLDNKTICYPNNKHMLRCPKCKKPINKRNEKFNTLLKNRTYDISMTLDEVMIVSQRFYDLYVKEKLDGLDFTPLNNDRFLPTNYTGFYIAKPYEKVRIDLNRAQFITSGNKCPECGYYPKVVEGNAHKGQNIIDKHFFVPPNSFVRSDIVIGEIEAKYPLLFCGDKVAKVLQKNEIKGLVLEELSGESPNSKQKVPPLLKGPGPHIKVFEVSGGSNDTFFYDDRADIKRCPKCRRMIDKWSAPVDQIKLCKKKDDISSGYDGVDVVSQKFKDMYEQEGLIGLGFCAIKTPGFYTIMPTITVKVDLDKAEVKYEGKDCDKCGSFREVYGGYIFSGDDIFKDNEKFPLNGFVRTDLEWGESAQSNPIIYCGEFAASVMKKYNLRGLYLREQKDLYTASKHVDVPSKPKTQAKGKTKGSMSPKIKTFKKACESLKNILAAPAPGFKCSGAGSKSSKTYIAAVEHELGDSAKTKDWETLKKLLPKGNAQLLEFYSKHNGVLLFADTKGDAAGFELFPVSKMKKESKEMYEWLDIFPDEEDELNLKSAIAIGCVPNSGNYFAMTTKGKDVGKIFLVNHEEITDSAFVDSFDELMDKLASDPCGMISGEFEGYARYSDGKSKTQWIPEEYIPNITKQKAK